VVPLEVLVQHLVTRLVDLGPDRMEPVALLFLEIVEVDVHAMHRDPHGLELQAERLGQRGDPFVHALVLQVELLAFREGTRAEGGLRQAVGGDLGRAAVRPLEGFEEVVHLLLELRQRHHAAPQVRRSCWCAGPVLLWKPHAFLPVSLRPVVPVSRVVRLPSRDLVSFRSPSDHDRNGTTLVIRTDSPNCHMQSLPYAPVVPHLLFTGRYGIPPRLLTCLTSFSGVSHTVPSSGRRATARFRRRASRMATAVPPRPATRMAVPTAM